MLCFLVLAVLLDAILRTWRRCAPGRFSIIRSSSRQMPGSISKDARHMPHLATRAGFALAVDVDVGALFGDQLGPAVEVAADEIVHRRAAADEVGRAGRKVADGADVLLELRGDSALDRPVAAIVHARRDFVHHWP